MNNILNWAADKAATKLGISKEDARLIYKSYWKFIREKITEKDISNADKDFNPVNVNLPYIGKLYTGYDNILRYNKKIKYYNVKVKKD